MKQQWLRVGFLWLLAMLVAAGCSSTGTQEPVDPPAPPVEEKQPEPAAPPEPTAPPAPEFGADGYPYVPGTTRPLGRTVYFDFDRAVIKPGDLAMLEMHAQVLRKHRDRSITIEGHCDERGTREYNLALGERRADAIRQFLTSAGVNRSQVDIVSFGEERPADPGHTEAAWSRNRRGVLLYR